jgi:hypothetical protein
MSVTHSRFAESYHFTYHNAKNYWAIERIHDTF